MGKPKRNWKNVLKGQSSKEFCIYCGDPKRVRDHYRPWSVSQSRFVLPSCKSCNVILGDTWHDTLGERAAWIAESLEKTHRKLLEAPLEEAMEETEGALKTYLESEDAKRHHIQLRINSLRAMESAGRDVVLDYLHNDEDSKRLLEGILEARWRNEVGRG